MFLDAYSQSLFCAVEKENTPVHGVAAAHKLEQGTVKKLKDGAEWVSCDLNTESCTCLVTLNPQSLVLTQTLSDLYEITLNPSDAKFGTDVTGCDLLVYGVGTSQDKLRLSSIQNCPTDSDGSVLVQACDDGGTHLMCQGDGYVCKNLTPVPSFPPECPDGCDARREKKKVPGK